MPLLPVTLLAIVLATVPLIGAWGSGELDGALGIAEREKRPTHRIRI
jgi:hypothetical protein